MNTMTEKKTKTYDLETGGPGWSWSASVEAANVSEAIATAYRDFGVLSEIEADTNVGLYRFDLDHVGPPSEWTINGRDCLVEEVADDEFEVSLIERAKFPES